MVGTLETFLDPQNYRVVNVGCGRADSDGACIRKLLTEALYNGGGSFGGARVRAVRSHGGGSRFASFSNAHVRSAVLLAILSWNMGEGRMG